MLAVYRDQLWRLGDTLAEATLTSFDGTETLSVDFGAKGLVVDPTDTVVARFCDAHGRQHCRDGCAVKDTGDPVCMACSEPYDKTTSDSAVPSVFCSAGCEQDNALEGMADEGVSVDYALGCPECGAIQDCTPDCPRKT